MAWAVCSQSRGQSFLEPSQLSNEAFNTRLKRPKLSDIPRVNARNILSVILGTEAIEVAGS